MDLRGFILPINWREIREKETTQSHKLLKEVPISERKWYEDQGMVSELESPSFPRLFIAELGNFSLYKNKQIDQLKLEGYFSIS